ncbi:MAG TPA: transporter substrate-binding domain-containing protein [Acidimicrobiales bacterium]|nr:transporter substrate-binding domain-containing protein [Acidimicrobiales bacterium]
MSTRPVLRLPALLLCAGLLFAACGGSDDADTSSAPAKKKAAADVEHLVKDGKLTVCSDIPYAPFEYEDGGALKGVDVDLMKGIAGELGLEADFRDTDFDGIFASLAAGNCDVIASSVSITDERKQANNFTEGYFEINQSMLVRKGEESKYKDFASLEGKTIGVQSETTGAAFATTEAADVGARIKEFTGADELFTALKAKQIDAVVQDFPINSYNAVQTGDTVVSATFDSDEAEQYGFVVPKDKPKLLAAIDDALRSLHDNGRYDEIIEEYLGDVTATKS